MKEMKIMLVDDEERFLATTGKLLEKKGYAVITAGSGAEALEKLTDADVDVVILDVKMPGLDGVATLKEIKKVFPLIEVIMLTGHATVESAVDGLKSGAFDYVMKPCDIDDLVNKATEAFKKRQEMMQKIRDAYQRDLIQRAKGIL